MKSTALVIGASLTFLFACTRPLEATTIHLTAETCHDCWSGSFPDIDIDALLTVELVTGEFFVPAFGDFLNGTFPTVVALEGLMNGLPMSLATPGGSLSWFFSSNLYPILLNFTVAGLDYRIIDDFAFVIFQERFDGGDIGQLPLRWNATEVPVPDGSSSLLLLSLSLIGVALWKGRARFIR